MPLSPSEGGRAVARQQRSPSWWARCSPSSQPPTRPQTLLQPQGPGCPPGDARRGMPGGCPGPGLAPAAAAEVRGGRCAYLVLAPRSSPAALRPRPARGRRAPAPRESSSAAGWARSSHRLRLPPPCDSCRQPAARAAHSAAGGGRSGDGRRGKERRGEERRGGSPASARPPAAKSPPGAGSGAASGRSRPGAAPHRRRRGSEHPGPVPEAGARPRGPRGKSSGLLPRRSGRDAGGMRCWAPTTLNLSPATAPPHPGVSLDKFVPVLFQNALGSLAGMCLPKTVGVWLGKRKR